MAENHPVRALKITPAEAEVRIPEPPSHLSDEAGEMWAEIVRQWVIGPEALPLLRAGLEQWDSYQAARAVLAEEGPTVQTGKSMVRTHPAAGVAKDALREFRLCFKQLGLEPPKEG